MLLQSLLSVSLVLQSHPRMENKQFLDITLLKYAVDTAASALATKTHTR